MVKPAAQGGERIQLVSIDCVPYLIDGLNADGADPRPTSSASDSKADSDVAPAAPARSSVKASNVPHDAQNDQRVWKQSTDNSFAEWLRCGNCVFSCSSPDFARYLIADSLSSWLIWLLFSLISSVRISHGMRPLQTLPTVSWLPPKSPLSMPLSCIKYMAKKRKPQSWKPEKLPKTLPSSKSEALAISNPVRSETTV